MSDNLILNADVPLSVLKNENFENGLKETAVYSASHLGLTEDANYLQLSVERSDHLQPMKDEVCVQAIADSINIQLFKKDAFLIDDINDIQLSTDDAYVKVIVDSNNIQLPKEDARLIDDINDIQISTDDVYFQVIADVITNQLPPNDVYVQVIDEHQHPIDDNAYLKVIEQSKYNLEPFITQENRSNTEYDNNDYLQLTANGTDHNDYRFLKVGHEKTYINIDSKFH